LTGAEIVEVEDRDAGGLDSRELETLWSHGVQARRMTRARGC
jgi:hypothetical protein